MDIRHVGDHECIQCGACIGECPAKAISFKAGRITLHGPEIADQPQQVALHRRRRRWAWAAALAVLCVVFVAVNLPDAVPDSHLTVSGTPAEPDAAVGVPTGKEVGMTAPDFNVPLYGGNGGTFRLSEHRGKTVVVNFWATWCTPCVQELPYFDEVARSRDDVAVVAIHSELVTDDVDAYLARFDYQMPFALDEAGDVIAAFGGSTMLPQTVVIDENGIITYNAVGSVTLEKLLSLLPPAAFPKAPEATQLPSPTPGLRLDRTFPR